MEGYGERMQYSIFRCWLTRLEMERLRWELTQMLTTEDDVLLIPLCPACVEGICGTHEETSWPSAPARHQIV
jgi:CRISPR-associated protein Cas2